MVSCDGVLWDFGRPERTFTCNDQDSVLGELEYASLTCA